MKITAAVARTIHAPLTLETLDLVAIADSEAGRTIKPIVRMG